jgi:hypothetical protein
MIGLYLLLATILMLSLVVIINHNNFTYAETNITTDATANGSNTNYPSYLMNQSNYFCEIYSK